MSEAPLRILLIEDSPGDARLLELALEESGLPIRELVHVSHLSEARTRLGGGAVDVLLMDLRLPGVQGLAALEAVHELAADVPVVVLTALGGESFALESVRKGAHEFLAKADLDGDSLARAVRFALQRRQHEQRTSFLLRAIESVAATLDAESVLRSLAHLVVPALGDWCVIELVDGGGHLRVAEIVAADEAKQALLQAKLARYRHGRSDGRHPVDEVLRSGNPCRCEVDDEAARARIAYDEEHLRLLRELDPRSMLVVPLMAGDRVMGTVSLTVSESRRRFAAEDERLAVELGRTGGAAVANALQYRDSQEARARAETIAARARRMERMGAALARAASLQRVAAVTIDNGTQASQAMAAAVLLLEETRDRLHLIRAVGLPDAVRAAWSHVPLEPSSPLVDAFRATGPLVRLQPAALRAGCPELDGAVPAEAGFVGVPLRTDGGALGLLLLVTPDASTELDEEMLAQCGGRSAIAMERTLLFEREQTARQEARHAIRGRDEVLAIVAHDLRTPLSVIATYAGLLRDGELAEEEPEKAAEAILAAARQMDRLIQDLLDVSRLDSGLLQLVLEPVEPDSLLRQAVGQARALALEKGIELRLEDSSRLPAIRADYDRTLQVLSNLVGNAVKFTPAPGSVSVRAESLENEVLFLISDTGPGIPIEDQPHLFDRFWQARHARRAGSGLGLAIVKQIVQLHGGRVGVESRPGSGSIFFFTIPTAQEEAAVEATAPTPAAPAEGERNKKPPGAGRVRVLVVDDHPVVRRGLRQLLQGPAGLEVVAEAGTAEEAIQLVPLARPDVVLMDLRLPGMDGIEAIREVVRADPRIKVLALTAEAEATTLLAVLEAGGSGFVRKTTAHEDLVPAIEAAVQGDVFLYPSGNRLLLQSFRMRDADADADPALAALTEQEREVLALAAEGYTSAEIGKKLFLSPKTVDSYRSRAMHKVGIGSRAELVQFAIRCGLLTTG